MCFLILGSEDKEKREGFVVVLVVKTLNRLWLLLMNEAIALTH
jgi:hypothetical protein